MESGPSQCPSFPCFFGGKWPEKPPTKQGFAIPTEPLKSLEKKGKTLKKTRNFSQGRKKTRNSKRNMERKTGSKSLGKENTVLGCVSLFRPFSPFFCLFGPFPAAPKITWQTRTQGKEKPSPWFWGLDWECGFLPLLVLMRRGAAPVKTSTGNNFPRRYQRVSPNCYQHWCLLKFGNISAF